MAKQGDHEWIIAHRYRQMEELRRFGLVRAESAFSQLHQLEVLKQLQGVIEAMEEHINAFEWKLFDMEDARNPDREKQVPIAHGKLLTLLQSAQQGWSLL